MELDFDGSNYIPELDRKRLGGQMREVFFMMDDGIWRTLRDISELTGFPEASISAQLRHLRKEKFGSHIVNKRRRGDPKLGIWEYKLIVNEKAVQGELKF